MTYPASSPKSFSERRNPAVPEQVIDAVGAAVGRLRYGVVQLTVHEGRVVQLEVTERQRFN